MIVSRQNPEKLWISSYKRESNINIHYALDVYEFLGLFGAYLFERTSSLLLSILKHLRQFVQSDWFLPVFLSHDKDTVGGAPE